MNICLLNDSFPPFIDGVANTVKNYAENLLHNGQEVFVATPSNPKADDSIFPYPVLRYPSLNTNMVQGYRVGYPFPPEIAGRLSKENIDIIHSHCPAVSNLLGRALRDVLKAPLIFTYHTKFDFDIATITSSPLGQAGLTKVMIDNVQACDEVWVVSRGAGENLKSLGYEGNYILMPNGVDMPKGRIPETETMSLTAASLIAVNRPPLPLNIPVFLYVGRMMWYKGIKITLEALAALKSQEMDFRMVFIGGGQDSDEIKKLCSELGLDDKVIFIGPVRDRTLLRAWYCRADLFLFPSSYDTNGLVVREAAASSLPAVLIKGSCAAEDVTNIRNGFLAEENSASLAVCITRICDNMAMAKDAGRRAADEIYLSWADAVKLAENRYRIVSDNYKRGLYEKHNNLSDYFISLQSSVMDTIFRFGENMQAIEQVGDTRLVKDSGFKKNNRF